MRNKNGKTDGRGRAIPGPEARAKMRAAKLGKPLSDAHRAAMSAGQRASHASGLRVTTVKADGLTNGQRYYRRHRERILATVAEYRQSGRRNMVRRERDRMLRRQMLREAQS